MIPRFFKLNGGLAQQSHLKRNYRYHSSDVLFVMPPSVMFDVIVIVILVTAE